MTAWGSARLGLSGGARPGAALGGAGLSRLPSRRAEPARGPGRDRLPPGGPRRAFPRNFRASPERGRWRALPGLPERGGAAVVPVKEPERGCAGGAVGALLARKPHLAEVKPLIEVGTLLVPVPGAARGFPRPAPVLRAHRSCPLPAGLPGLLPLPGSSPARRGIVCNCVGDGLRRAQVIV